MNDLDQTADEMAGYIRGKRDVKQLATKYIKEIVDSIKSSTDEDTADWATIDPRDVVEWLEEAVQRIERI